MRIIPGQPKDDSPAEKNYADRHAADRRRQIFGGRTGAAQHGATESPAKQETKFADLLESAAKPPKAEPTKEELRRGDEKKDKKQAARESDSSDIRSGSDRIERYDSSGGGQFGSGFGDGNINQNINLSENFAARSILHIADLERMISAVRTQTIPGGKREIQLELKRSVLKGLKVKISTDPAAQVRIEFLAANEKVRSQIENHSDELAEILRGRGINLQSLTTMLDFENQDSSRLA